MQVLLSGILNTHVNALCLRAAFTTLAPILHESQARAGSCRANALARSVKPSLGGKRPKPEAPVFSFRSIRKSATSTGPLGGFSDLRESSSGTFPKIRKSATRMRKPESFGFAVSGCLRCIVV